MTVFYVTPEEFAANLWLLQDPREYDRTYTEAITVAEELKRQHNRETFRVGVMQNSTCANNRYCVVYRDDELALMLASDQITSQVRTMAFSLPDVLLYNRSKDEQIDFMTAMPTELTRLGRQMRRLLQAADSLEAVVSRMRAVVSKPATDVPDAAEVRS